MAEIKIVKPEPPMKRCGAALCVAYAQPRKKLCKSCEDTLTALEPAPRRKCIIELDEREAQLLHVIIGGVHISFVKATFETHYKHYYTHIPSPQSHEVSKLTGQLYETTKPFRVPENGLD